MNGKNDAAPAGGHRGCEKCSALGTPGNPTTNLPRGWRAQLPMPAAYYRHYLGDLTAPDDEGQAFAECPLCMGRLFVRLGGRRGSWRCTYCQAGGEMVSFHMRRNGLPFETAVLDLLAIGARLRAPDPNKVRRLLAHCAELAKDGQPLDAAEAAAFAQAKARQHARDVGGLHMGRAP